MTLYAGRIALLPPNNKPSGIFKQKLTVPVWLGREGLAGDEQADRRVHGGPEKALHQYPVAHYARLAAAFPEQSAQLLPGSIGENLSVPGWDESEVCLGDIFRLGQATIQVSQPRSPCWKIDDRYGVEGMTRFIDANCLTGWYYRVLEEGLVAPDAAFTLFERTAPEMTLQHLLGLCQAHRPAPADLLAVAGIPSLATNWVKKLTDRAAWLRQFS